MTQQQPQDPQVLSLTGRVLEPSAPEPGDTPDILDDSTRLFIQHMQNYLACD